MLHPVAPSLQRRLQRCCSLPSLFEREGQDCNTRNGVDGGLEFEADPVTSVLQIDIARVRVRLEPDDRFAVAVPDAFGTYRPATRLEVLLLLARRPDLRGRALVPGDEPRRQQHTKGRHA